MPDYDFTYMPGFERDFKQAVKLYGTYSHLSKKYEYTRPVLSNDESNDEDEVWRAFFAAANDSDEAEDDDFDVSRDPSSERRAEALARLDHNHAFYYRITDAKPSDDDEDDCPYDFVIIVLLPVLVKDLNAVVSDTVTVEDSMWVCRPRDLFCSINDFRGRLASGDDPTTTAPLRAFVEALEHMFQRHYGKFDKQLQDNRISHDALWYHLDHRGALYEIEFYKHKLVYYHSHFQYTVKMGGSVVLELIGVVKEMSAAHRPVYRRITHQIPHYSKYRALESFNIRRVTDFDALRERSSRVLKLLTEPQQMHFCGTHIVHTGEGVVKIGRDERVVVDNLHRDEDLFENILPLKEYSLFESELTDEISLEDSNIELTLLPFVPAYNLGVMKSWGLAHVDQLRPVEFGTGFDDIIMDETKKSLIHRMVTSYSSSTSVVNDVVEKKNSGLVLLLHGPSGVGKTLTAEIIADITHKPLYKLSCGELTLDTSRAEIVLHRVSKLCEKWNAVLLLDEADIFLEERGFSPVRDGLVALFLRFIEYCSCIVVLTTNRLSKLDPSIQSRLNLLVEYPKLTDERRREIWTKILGRTGRIEKKKLSSITKKLCHHKLNGRQIYKATQTTLLVSDENCTTTEFVAEIQKIIGLTQEYEQSRKVEGLYN